MGIGGGAPIPVPPEALTGNDLDLREKFGLLKDTSDGTENLITVVDDTEIIALIHDLQAGYEYNDDSEWVMAGANEVDKIVAEGRISELNEILVGKTKIPVDTEMAIALNALREDIIIREGFLIAPEGENEKGAYEAYIAAQSIAVAIWYRRERGLKTIQEEGKDNQFTRIADKTGNIGAEDITIEVIEYLQKNFDGSIMEDLIQLFSGEYRKSFIKALAKFKSYYKGARDRLRELNMSGRYDEKGSLDQ